MAWFGFAVGMVGAVGAWARPVNDFFSAAEFVDGSDAVVAGSNIEATLEAGEPFGSDGQIQSSIWYAWRAPADGTAVFSTAGMTFSHVMGVFRGGGEVGNLTTLRREIAVAGTFATVSLEVQKSRVYSVAIASYFSPFVTGTTQLTISFSEAAGGGDGGADGEGKNGGGGESPDREGPRIRLLAPADRQEVTRGRIAVRGRVADNEGTAGVNLIVDRRRARIGAGGRFRQRVRLATRPSRNVIRLKATDSDGNVTERRRVVFYVFANQPPPSPTGDPTVAL